MSYQIDHVFVLSAGHGEAARRLAEAGFSLAPRRDHPGQGTANVCLHLENGYLEILWVDRRREVTSPTTRPTGLDERSRWSETGASPVGIALRARDGAQRPFPCIAYRPAYLPGDAAILIADESAAAGAPLVFILPPELKRRVAATGHVNGARRITSITVATTLDLAGSPVLAMLERDGLCAVEVGGRHALRIELDHGRQGACLDIGPGTPLTLAW